MRASLDWAFSPGGDAQIGAALTAAAVPLWVQLSLLAECREVTELALAKSTRPPPTHCDCSCIVGRAWLVADVRCGRAREAGPAWAATLQLAEQLGDSDYLLRALWGLCIDQFNNGEFRKALEFAHRFAAVGRFQQFRRPDDGRPAFRYHATLSR